MFLQSVVLASSLAFKKLIPDAIPSPIIFPKGPRTINVTGAVMINVSNGFVKNLIGFGEILSANGSTNDINHIAKIIGITDEE